MVTELVVSQHQEYWQTTCTRATSLLPSTPLSTHHRHTGKTAWSTCVISDPHETFRGFLNTSGFVFASSSLFKRSDHFHVSWKPGLQLKSEETRLWTSHVIDASVVRSTTCWQVAILNTWAWIVRDTGSLLHCCLQFSWRSEHLWWSQSRYLGALIAWCVNHVCLRT